MQITNWALGRGIPIPPERGTKHKKIRLHRQHHPRYKKIKAELVIQITVIYFVVKRWQVMPPLLLYNSTLLSGMNCNGCCVYHVV